MHAHGTSNLREALAAVCYPSDRVAFEFKTKGSAFFSHDTSWSALSPTLFECPGKRYKLKFVLPQNRTQCRLRQHVRCGQILFYLNDRFFGVNDVEIEHGV